VYYVPQQDVVNNTRLLFVYSTRAFDSLNLYTTIPNT